MRTLLPAFAQSAGLGHIVGGASGSGAPLRCGPRCTNSVKIGRRPRARYFPSACSATPNDPESLASRLAQAFVAACTPSDVPYTTQLATFCREALSAYTNGYSLTAIQLELSGAKTSVGRALASDEVELRSVWLSLVYKTLRQIGFPISGQASTPSDGFDRDRIDDFVTNIVSAARRGYDMKRIQLEQAMTASERNDSSRTPLENAILNQSTRIVLTTLQVADEQTP